MDKLEKFLENYSGVYKWHNPNILLDVINEIQKILEFSFILEEVDKKYVPKLFIGEESDEVDSSITLDYNSPSIFISLSRREACGSNPESTKELFNGNLISGVPKFHRKYFEEENNEETKVEEAVIFTDNEITFTLRTKTVKEQLKVINILERALNVYCRHIMSHVIVVCGIKNIQSSSRKENGDFEVSKINFQLRLKEQLTLDRGFILKAFGIFSGKEDIFEYNSSKIDNEGNWIDNETETEYEHFFIKK